MLIKILLLVVLAVAFVLTWRNARVGSTKRFSAFLWSLLWIGAALVVIQPNLASRFANLVGVGRGVDAVIYFALIALFYLVFRVFAKIESLERKITTLIRELAFKDADQDPHEPK